jgi:hypothetical protein
MRRCVSLAVPLLCVLAVAPRGAADDKTAPDKTAPDKTAPDKTAPGAKDKSPAERPKVKLAAGENVSANFHPYNVTAAVAPKADPEEDGGGKKKIAYTTKGKFHCPITEYDLDPVVMLFARGNLDEAAGFRELLQKTDAAIERNPGVRLRSFVVFIADDIVNVVTDDDKREEAAKKIQKLADELKLRHVVLTLASKADVAPYPLDPGTALTAVLYKNLRIEAVHRVPLDKLEKAGGAAAKAVLADVAGKLKATR